MSGEQNEGEAQRFFDHAHILRSTIYFLRNNTSLPMFSGFRRRKSDEPSPPESSVSAAGINDKPDPQRSESQRAASAVVEDEPLALDLIRCESLASLDDDSRQRLLAKNYSLLFSMAPYTSAGDAATSPPICADAPFHFGPAVPEMNSVWFRLYVGAEIVGDGACSLLVPRGQRLGSLPRPMKAYEKVSV